MGEKKFWFSVILHFVFAIGAFFTALILGDYINSLPPNPNKTVFFPLSIVVLIVLILLYILSKQRKNREENKNIEPKYFNTGE